MQLTKLKFSELKEAAKYNDGTVGKFFEEIIKRQKEIENIQSTKRLTLFFSSSIEMPIQLENGSYSCMREKRINAEFTKEEMIEHLKVLMKDLKLKIGHPKGISIEKWYNTLKTFSKVSNIETIAENLVADPKHNTMILMSAEIPLAFSVRIEDYSETINITIDFDN